MRAGNGAAVRDGSGLDQPLVTISLVTYNGSKWIAGCLGSVQRQTLSSFEFLVLDNASVDGTVEALRQFSTIEPRMQLVESSENLGYAGGHNRNIFKARGEVVLLLNQDVQLDDDFLIQATAALEGKPTIGAIQGRLRRLSDEGQRTDILDSTGLAMHRDRRVVSRFQGERDGVEHAEPGPVWGVDGPAPVYRRRALLEAQEPRTPGGWEVLDEDFFMYKEDVDLAWRLRRLGWGAWYAPRAIAWHARGAGGSPVHSLADIARSNRTIPRWIKAISWRNQRLMQVKNERPAAFIRDLPWILRREVLSLGFMVVVDPLRLRVIPDLVRALPAAARKRRWIERRLRARGI